MLYLSQSPDFFSIWQDSSSFNLMMSDPILSLLLLFTTKSIINMHVCMHVCFCIYVHMYGSVCMYVHTYVHVHACEFVCICKYVQMTCVYVCMC